MKRFKFRGIFKARNRFANMLNLRHRLHNFGRKYGFIPKTKGYETLRDDFGHVDRDIRDVAKKVKEEIDE